MQELRTPAKEFFFFSKSSEVVNFVATTRRWYDKGNLRDAGVCDACRMVLSFDLVSSKELAFSFFEGSYLRQVGRGQRHLYGAPYED